MAPLHRVSRLPFAACALTLVASCVEPAPPVAPSPTWACPAGWVASSLGGCGPAALLCARDGGSANDACAETPPDAIFVTRPDGPIGGRWREPDEPGGAPLPSWRPDAGFTVCPAGWSLDRDRTCMPTEARCEGESAALPGGACVPGASPSCAESPSPVDLPPGAVVVRVRAGAVVEGADGSNERPFASIARAIEGAAPDAWVLVAPGTYTERVTVLDRALHLRGACWERTVIRAPADLSERGAVAVVGSSARLDLGDITVEGPRGSVWAAGGASLVASRVRVGPSTNVGFYVGGAGTRAALDRVLVRDVSPNAAGENGLGIRVDGGASLTLRDVAIVRATSLGLSTSGSGTRVEGERVLVRDVREGGAEHMGLRALAGAVVRLRGAVIVRAFTTGVASVGSGSRVELDGALVTGVRPRAGLPSRGIYTELGGSVVARRVTVRDNQGPGVAAYNPGSSVVLEDATVLAHTSAGAYASDHAALTLTRVELAQNVGAGVSVNMGASASLADVIVRTTSTSMSGNQGHGAEALRDATLSARGLLVEDAHEAGVLALGHGARIELTDALVRNTLPRADGHAGLGLVATDGAALLATRTRLEGNRDTAAIAQGGSLEFRDGVIVDTRPALRGGSAVIAALGGAATLERTLIQGAVENGAVATGAGASLRLRDVAVRDIVPRPRDQGGGWGVAAFHGASVVADGVLVERASRAGVIAYADDARVELRDAIITDVRGAGTGFGAGLMAVDRAHVVAARVAVLGAGGAGVASTAYSRADASVYGATLRASDLFVRGVRASSVDDIAGQAPPVAYGVSVGRDCALDLERATVLDADWGFFHSAGSLTLRRALVARQRRSAGAASLVDARHPLRLEDLSLRENASNEIARDIDLPSLRLEPPPEPELPRLSD